MPTKTNVEQLAKFDEVVAHYSADPNRRSEPSPRGRLSYDSQDRFSPMGIIMDVEAAKVFEGYMHMMFSGSKLPSYLICDRDRANTVNQQMTHEWGAFMPFVAESLHECNTYWTETSISPPGQMLVDMTRRILGENLIPADDEFGAAALHILKSGNMHQGLFEYIMKLAEAKIDG